MTAAEREFEQAVMFFEDQVTDLRTLLRSTPRDELGSRQMARTLSRLRGAAVDATAIYLTAHAIAQGVK